MDLIFAWFLALFTPQTLSITVQTQQEHQRLEHFGASAAWWATEVGTWPEADRNALLDALFDPVHGIGLTLVRYNLGAGKAGPKLADPWREAETPYRTDGTLDWSVDQSALDVIDGAVKRGARVVVFANSPPAPLTITLTASGNKNKSNLAPEQRPVFARFLAQATQELQRRWPVVAVSPFNEPQWDWQLSNGQEGSHYSPSEALATLQAVNAEFQARGLEVKLSPIESGQWDVAHNAEYLTALQSDPALWLALGPYSVHSYWSQDNDRLDFVRYLSQKAPGTQLWMSEWTEMRSGKDLSMKAGLALALTVHADLTLAHVSSWQYWIAASKYDWADGLVYVDTQAHTFEPTKKLSVLGQWSRFVRPGAVNLEAGPDVVPKLRASAFRNTDGSLAVVVVNASGQDRSAEIRGVGTKPEAWRTSASEDLAPLGLLGAGPIVFPLSSVTTLVYR
jgi:O-glycosyl hydrolase